VGFLSFTGIFAASGASHCFLSFRGIIPQVNTTNAHKKARRGLGDWFSGGSGLWLRAVRLLAAGPRAEPLPLVSFAEGFAADRADGGKDAFQRGFG